MGYFYMVTVVNTTEDDDSSSETTKKLNADSLLEMEIKTGNHARELFYTKPNENV